MTTMRDCWGLTSYCGPRDSRLLITFQVKTMIKVFSFILAFEFSRFFKGFSLAYAIYALHVSTD